MISIMKRVFPGFALYSAVGFTMLFSVNVYAATECRLDISGGQVDTITVNYPALNFKSKVTGAPVLLGSYVSGRNEMVRCGTGDDGDDFYGHSTSPYVTSIPVVTGQSYSAALFETNIPGIVFAVRMNIKGMNLEAYIPTYTKETNLNNDTAGKSMADTIADFYIDVYQTAAFTAIPEGVTSVKEAGSVGRAGDFRIGVKDSNNRALGIDPDLNIPFTAPTCTTLLASNGGVVALGDYFVSDFKDNSDEKIVDFSLTASGCVNVTQFITSFTSNSLEHDLLTNTLSGSDAAQGVGVKIYSKDENNPKVLKPGDRVIKDAFSIFPTNQKLDFGAQLVTDGNTLKSGAFKGTAVFTMSYN